MSKSKKIMIYAGIIIGLLPSAALILYGIINMFAGVTAFFETYTGIQAFIVTVLFYFIIYWPVIISGWLISVSSAILRIISMKKFNIAQ